MPKGGSCGFTLAEVLIVLGIIGLIADMTIPTIINQSQKRIAETRILKFYSSMHQAVKLSEVDNGPFKGPQKIGKDRFPFILCPYMSACTGYRDGFSTYKCDIPQSPTRENFQTGTLGCRKNYKNGYYCTALIEYDGWKIADDYPW